MSSWCKDFITRKHKYDARKFETMISFARKGFPVSGCFTPTWLKKVVNQADKMWFDDQLMANINKAYKSHDLLPRLMNDDDNVAGFVVENKNKNKITLRMNCKLFSNLFSNGEHGLHAGGNVCTTKLRCFIDVLVHEMVHMFLTLCETINIREDKIHHGKLFNKLTRELFSHTSSRHGLINKYDQTHSIGELKKLVHPGLSCTVFINNKFMPCKVVKKGYHNIIVQLDHNKRLFKVYIGLIKLKS